MDKCTENYEALVLFNKTQSNDISESLFWYRADLELCKKMQLCNRSFWRIHEHFSDETEDERFPAGRAIDNIVQADEDGRTKVAAQAREVELPEAIATRPEDDTKSFGFSNYRDQYHGSDDLRSDAFAFDAH
jgi:hypothetical protein